MADSKQNAIKEKGAALRLRLSDKWRDIRERLHHKHRFVVMDTDTFKETFSVELTGTNVFTYVGISIIVLLLLASLIIAFTPLRGLIPGYIKPELREEAIRNAQVIDSLEVIIAQHEQHIGIIQDVINGKTVATAPATATETVDEKTIVYRHTRADSLLRQEIEKRAADKKKQEKSGKKKNRKK